MTERDPNAGMLDFVFLIDLEERPQLHFLAPYVL